MSWLSKAFDSITGGDILGFAGGLLGANSKNKANTAATQQSIAFEREKAQNAHQWEVEDLRKAGLNPILSAGGSGASTGSPTIIPAGENPFAEGLNSASANRIAREQIEKLENDNRLMRDTFQTQVDTFKQTLENSAKQNEKLQAEIDLLKENQRNVSANNYLIKQGIDMVGPVIEALKPKVSSAIQNPSFIDDIGNGLSNAWEDLISLYSGKHYNKPTPNHKNNDWMKGRRGWS